MTAAQRSGIIAFIAGVLIVVVAASCGSSEESVSEDEQPTPTPTTETGVNWVEVPDRGTSHIDPGAEHPPYNSTPATSGWHYGHPFGPAKWGVYDEPLPDEILVHNLEHGGIGIHYDCPAGCPNLVEKLEDLALRTQRAVLSPYPGMDTTIALTAWNFIDNSEEFDGARIQAFIDAHLDSGRAPESGHR